MLRKTGYLLFWLLFAAAFLWSDLIIYGLRQLKGQLTIIQQAVPVEDVIGHPATPDSIRDKLLFIQEVRKYAQDSLGLNESDNYTTLYDQKGKPAIWVITACEPFRLEAYHWNFPFLGSVSYKGFFQKELGYPEVNRLRKLGYDVEYSPAGGWSTLGFFRDPVLSNMLRRNKGQLAELIIHELTHATIYKSGEVEFNENLATFIGEQGALQFLLSKYGEVGEYQRYKNELEDEQRFGEFMVGSVKELKSFYDSLPENLSIPEKHLAKYRKIASIVIQINQLPLHFPDRYRYDLPKEPLPDNTFFMGYQRYRGEQGELQEIFNSTGKSVKDFILRMK